MGYVEVTTAGSRSPRSLVPVNVLPSSRIQRVCSAVAYVVGFGAVHTAFIIGPYRSSTMHPLEIAGRVAAVGAEVRELREAKPVAQLARAGAVETTSAAHRRSALNLIHDVELGRRWRG
jgi:hypothetical protein